MKWQGRKGSSNIEDRRSSGGSMGLKLGLPGVLIVGFIYLMMGGNPISLIPMLGGATTQEYVESEGDQEKMEFLSVMLKDTEDVWTQIFNEYNMQYDPAKLVVFHAGVKSACGQASAQMGPFYCPLDQSVYIDLDFFDELKHKFGAPGDFAISYVLAHEIGHHVQDLLGILGEKQQLRGKLSETEYNKVSVAIELQADYLAGVFASRVEEKGYLDVGDIEEAIKAAESVGDDVLQKKYQGTVVPDSFTHGSAEARKRWFMKGYEAGDLSQGDTFSYSYDDL
ncbi:MAG: neutral zinc metallopeptidase [Ezakiella sp.]|nr:neutral zinc metallopeptidase [Ezakiella sp.]MDD7761870.1 zinc metallopeptidase [Bacillota bacterium]MDY3946685.1 neutral zinc metallopeptidase [Ezakiella sp.]